VLGVVDDAHPALAEDVDDAITAYLCADRESHALIPPQVATEGGSYPLGSLLLGQFGEPADRPGRTTRGGPEAAPRSIEPV
jgi:hypothetical protein